MDWTTIGALTANLAVVVTIWWQLDSKFERRFNKIESTLQREREHIEGRLGAMAADITQVKTDVARILGRFEGQRDVHIAQGPPLPNYRTTTEERH